MGGARIEKPGRGSLASPTLFSRHSANRAHVPICGGLWDTVQTTGKARQHINLTEVTISSYKSVFTKEIHQKWNEGDLF